jgi:hypothetical protein
MGRLLLSGIAASFALFVGCTQSALNPTDTVVVKGSALNEDKSPIANATLKLHRSLNNICLLPDHFKDLKTDAQGEWTAELTGAETQNGELARCFDLRIPATEKGASASVRFMMQVTEVDVPQVQLWTGAVAADNSGPGAQVSFKKISETHDFSAEPSLSLQVGLHDAWRVESATSPVALSEYVLEDFEGLTARLHASQEVRGSGTRFNIHYGSDAVTLEKKSKVPVSRGLACQFGPKSFDAGACPVTNGKLDHGIPGEAAADLRIDFPQSIKLSRLVLRELTYSGNLVVEGSTNGGVSFEPLVTLNDQEIKPFTELALDATAPGVSAFRLRVTNPEGDARITHLRQLSLFE